MKPDVLFFTITFIGFGLPFAMMIVREYRMDHWRKSVRPQDAVKYIKDKGNFKIVVYRPDAKSVVLQNWDDDELTTADIKDIYPTYYEL